MILQDESIPQCNINRVFAENHFSKTEKVQRTIIFVET
jgi:hypothetical protein